mmetsp:Transcript_19558/g.23179  ORF Transcript_19558/g.23179 Transcript_19558/m.23179 type:complete len:114 (-) Transcript_19558:33-374(-)
MVPKAHVSSISDFRVHLLFDVMFETKNRLQLVDEESEEPYPASSTETEVHFLRMEGVLGTQDIRSSFWGFLKAKKLDRFLNHDPAHPVTEWTIIDIDNHLKGSPHVQVTEKEV